MTTAYGFRCIHYDREKEDSCDFSVGKIAEKSLNVSQLTELVTNGRTGTIRGFKSKNGKRFDACLCLEKDENGKAVIKFDFEHVEAKSKKMLSVRSVEVRSSRHRLGLDAQTIPKRIRKAAVSPLEKWQRNH